MPNLNNPHLNEDNNLILCQPANSYEYTYDCGENIYNLVEDLSKEIAEDRPRESFPVEVSLGIRTVIDLKLPIEWDHNQKTRYVNYLLSQIDSYISNNDSPGYCLDTEKQFAVFSMGCGYNLKQPPKNECSC